MSKLKVINLSQINHQLSIFYVQRFWPFPKPGCTSWISYLVQESPVKFVGVVSFSRWVLIHKCITVGMLPHHVSIISTLGFCWAADAIPSTNKYFFVNYRLHLPLLKPGFTGRWEVKWCRLFLQGCFFRSSKSRVIIMSNLLGLISCTGLQMNGFWH